MDTFLNVQWRPVHVKHDAQLHICIMVKIGEAKKRKLSQKM